MFSTYKPQRTTLITVLLALVAALILAACQAVVAQPANPNRVAQVGTTPGKLAVEVAEDPARFVFHGDLLFDDGMPQYGTPFITQGYIYPAGTLDGTNGVLADGSPEFPDKVLGDWTCYGWLVGDGMHTTSGPLVASTQIFRFGESYDGATLVSDGFELVDIGESVERVIAGGTGSLANATGMQVQHLMGMSEQMGVNLSIEFHLQ